MSQCTGGTPTHPPTLSLSRPPTQVSLLNEARAQKGLKQLGFLNPFLYQNPAAFTDVTLGTNAIGRGGEKLTYGFVAQAGWDAATGLGVLGLGLI